MHNPSFPDISRKHQFGYNHSIPNRELTIVKMIYDKINHQCTKVDIHTFEYTTVFAMRKSFCCRNSIEHKSKQKYLFISEFY